MDSKIRIVPCKTSLPNRRGTQATWPSKEPARKSKYPEPFDPHDLYRRLERYQDQLVRAEKRRLAEIERVEKVERERQKARTAQVPHAPQVPQAPKAAQAPKNAQVPQKYRHIPQNAAVGLVETASPDRVENIHPLSRLIPRSQKPDSQSPKNGLMSHHVEQADIALQVMMGAADRNQFQRSPDMHAAAEADQNRGLYKPPQRDFDTSLFAKHPHAHSELDSVDEEGELTGLAKARATFRRDDKNDWAQRDDCEEYERQTSKRRMFGYRRKKGRHLNTPAEPADFAEVKIIPRRKSMFNLF